MAWSINNIPHRAWDLNHLKNFYHSWFNFLLKREGWVRLSELEWPEVDEKYIVHVQGILEALRTALYPKKGEPQKTPIILGASGRCKSKVLAAYLRGFKVLRVHHSRGLEDFDGHDVILFDDMDVDNLDKETRRAQILKFLDPRQDYPLRVVRMRKDVTIPKGTPRIVITNPESVGQWHLHDPAIFNRVNIINLDDYEFEGKRGLPIGPIDDSDHPRPRLISPDAVYSDPIEQAYKTLLESKIN